MLAIEQKVTRLIALSASDHPEEARTSAYLACKMIREKGLIVVAELPLQAAPAPPPSACREERDKQPKIIRAKFDSLCLDCRAQIYVGERCVWIKGRGCWHPECAP